MNTVQKIILYSLGIMVVGMAISLLRPPMHAGALPVTVAQQKQVQVCNSPTDACSSFVTKYINPFIKLLTAVVGIGAALSLVIAGIQYSQSADDPSKVSKAKDRIVQTIIGLLAYIFLFAFLNYIIPGGLI